MTHDSVIAKNIRDIMEANGLKQCVVAKKAGYTPAVFNHMLCGRKIITATDIPRLAHALGVDCNALLDRNGGLR